MESGIDRFPILKLAVRHGGRLAVLLSVCAGALALAIAWPAWGAFGIVPAVFVGLVSCGVGKLLVEVVVLITEMLLPQ